MPRGARYRAPGLIFAIAPAAARGLSLPAVAVAQGEHTAVFHAQGEHTAVFHHVSPSLRVGTLASLTTLLAIGVFAWRAHSPRASRPGSAS